jgi:NAD(P)-dependent dehydrogenase (short-subunit alcohol dehydrogenase family)
MRTFAGETAIVTGGGSGIGRALAHRLAGAGASVVVTDIDGGRAAAVAAELARPGRPAWGRKVDHARLDEVTAFRDAHMAAHGRVDVLCCNVGVARTAPLTEMSVGDWEQVMGVNFWSAVYMLQLFVPAMVKRRHGRILVTASLAGLIGFPTASAYCASKFALVGLAESLRAELGRHGITVATLCPGIVRTRFARDGRFSFGELGVGGDAVDRVWQRVGEDPFQVARRGLRALAHGGGTAPSSARTVGIPWLVKRLSGDLVNAGLAFAWKHQERIARLVTRRPARPGDGRER